ncbi:hypothetical protein VUR80DRAFT_7583 [Thermomyces stellatus]
MESARKAASLARGAVPESYHESLVQADLDLVHRASRPAPSRHSVLIRRAGWLPHPSAWEQWVLVMARRVRGSVVGWGQKWATLSADRSPASQTRLAVRALFFFPCHPTIKEELCPQSGEKSAKTPSSRRSMVRMKRMRTNCNTGRLNGCGRHRPSLSSGCRQLSANETVESRNHHQVS